jgi:hypothetical protein
MDEGGGLLASIHSLVTVTRSGLFSKSALVLKSVLDAPDRRDWGWKKPRRNA